MTWRTWERIGMPPPLNLFYKTLRLKPHILETKQSFPPIICPQSSRIGKWSDNKWGSLRWFTRPKWTAHSPLMHKRDVKRKAEYWLAPPFPYVQVRENEAKWDFHMCKCHDFFGWFLQNHMQNGHLESQVVVSFQILVYQPWVISNLVLISC